MVKNCPYCSARNNDNANYCSSCGTSFTTSTPTVKPVPSVKVIQSASPIYQRATPLRVPPPGMCFYHPNLPAVYICNRCGRPICRDDAKIYGTLIICPQCYVMLPPLAPPPTPLPPQPIMYLPVRTVW
ncbi:zinc-ribbon domain-containing protein [[Eubacterium] cellulosolvens]